MQVEIWSDVMCPFCYIGKRKFENALLQFEHKQKVIVTWKSFQLNPSLKTDLSKNVYEYLAESNGWTLQHSKDMHANVEKMALEAGLIYNFDKAVIANSFDAHRFIQYAKTKNKGDEAEEILFKAYFTEGKNTADHTVLIELGTNLGFDEAELQNILATNAYSENVKSDIDESRQLGIRGVPFFVFNRQLAVSGAQPTEVFLQALQEAWDKK